MNKWIKYLLLGSFIWYIGDGLLGPLYAVFAQRIGGDILDLTGAYATYLIVIGVLSILIGTMSDRYPKKHFMVAGYGLNAIATFGYLLVDSPFRLFLIQGVLGVAVALSTPTWDSLFTLHIDKKIAGMEWGLSDGVPCILLGIATVVGGLIITYFSFTVLFVLMGTIATISTIVQAQILFFKMPRKTRRR